ncbi:NADP-dependent 3-hydroxy acid dehydrogenase YdfG [Amycolatopsis tolypomycina]|uniref:NADP-dependent 3-hydroxy acid dehydrogenase YdfG n=1 Tax=Amycolatopsis tolypomycina TaxID=208445 RepID=A0A1H4YUV2_9PSEU|nr:NADP-dependent 3-hydroxy acid dehydrogenase YdfG [Amycolatopsis tolypomycina]
MTPAAGTVALVTGASSGIGAATAGALAKRGALVVAAARRRARTETICREIVAAGGRAEAVEADIAVREQAARLVSDVVARHGRLDILVNNAGVMFLDQAEDAVTAEWDRMVAVNLSGVFHVTQAALPHLLKAAAGAERGVADIVNIGSTAGRTPFAGGSVYSSTKSALAAFSDALRAEITDRHVRVTVVVPGSVETELKNSMRPETMARFPPPPDGDILSAIDVAEAIVYAVDRPRHVSVDEIVIRPTKGF